MKRNVILKRLLFKFKMKHETLKRFFVSILILTTSFFLPILLLKSNPFEFKTEEGIMGLVSIIITAMSAIFIVFELHDSESVTCCDMLANMNLSFIGNNRLMLLYQRLEECYRNPQKLLVVEDSDDERAIHTSDIVAYFTFFEVLNEYIKHKVITIEQLDDLFGYRFFILVHNRYIQEHELYAVPSSYSNIFELYNVWIEYRKISTTDKGGRLVIMSDNQIPAQYLKEKNYLQHKVYLEMESRKVELVRSGKRTKFTVKNLFSHDLKMILALQKEITDTLPDKNYLEPSTEEEILESMLVDCCYGIFCEDKLVGFSLMVLNRKTKRNLAIDWEGCKNYDACSDYLTFDSVQVLPEFRGYGIQKYFLRLAEEIAIRINAKYVIATVSPHNDISYKNFKTMGYIPHKEKNPYIKYGKKRTLVRKDIHNTNKAQATTV